MIPFITSRIATLLETTVAPPGRVDRENGVLRGVKVLGAASQNGREYSQRAMRDALRLYEGARVFLDHPDRSSLEDTRSLREWVGTLRNVRFRHDGIYADMRLRRNCEHFDGIIEAAEVFPDSLGLSHNAQGKVVNRGGKQVVDRIEVVRSVDLVSTPATTKSLFESTRRRRHRRLIDQIRQPAVAASQSLAESIRRRRHRRLIDEIRRATVATATARHTPLIDEIRSAGGTRPKRTTQNHERLIDAVLRR